MCYDRRAKRDNTYVTDRQIYFESTSQLTVYLSVSETGYMYFSKFDANSIFSHLFYLIRVTVTASFNAWMMTEMKWPDNSGNKVRMR